MGPDAPLFASVKGWYPVKVREAVAEMQKAGPMGALTYNEFKARLERLVGPWRNPFFAAECCKAALWHGLLTLKVA